MRSSARSRKTNPNQPARRAAGCTSFSSPAFQTCRGFLHGSRGILFFAVAAINPSQRNLQISSSPRKHMLNILFWNLNGQARAVDLLGELAAAHDANLIAVVETPEGTNDIEERLATRLGVPVTKHSGLFNDRITVFSLGPVQF